MHCTMKRDAEAQDGLPLIDADALLIAAAALKAPHALGQECTPK